MALASKLALALGSLLLTGLVLEAGFRCAGFRGYANDRTVRVEESVLLAKEERTPGVRVQYRPHVEFEIAYDSNPEGYFNRRNGIVYRTNNHGLRGPDFPVQKHPETLRIGVLGDSFTFGEGVHWKDTFAHQLQLLLNVDFDAHVEVLNLGHSMWGTIDEINYLAHRGKHFDLDLVILVYVLNDADYAGDLDLYNQFRSIYEPTGLVRQSSLLSFIQVTIGREIYGQLYLRSKLKRSLAHSDDWERSLRLLGKGRNIARAAGADFSIVIFPFMYKLDASYPFTEIHDLVRSYAETREIPVLDLLTGLRGQRYTDLWVHPSDPHPNHRAHAIASQEIAAFVLDEGLLPSAAASDGDAAKP